MLPRVNEMELCVFGTSHHQLALEQRLDALEKQTLGHVQKGGVASRMRALEQVVGKLHAPLLPPLAPQLDLGQKEPPLAPALSPEPLLESAAAHRFGGSR